MLCDEAHYRKQAILYAPPAETHRLILHSEARKKKVDALYIESEEAILTYYLLVT